MLREGKSLFLVSLLVLAVLGILTLGPVTGSSTISLYVDGYDARIEEWTTVGSSPYLSTQNEPTDYVNVSAKNLEIGDFSFEDLSGSPTINSVYLYLYCDAVLEKINVYVWDGSGWSASYTFEGSGWAWRNVDVSAFLDTDAEVDAAKIYLESKAKGGWAGTVQADCAYLYVDYTEVVVDTTPPTWSNAGTNNTVPGQPTLFHVKWTDNVNMSGYIFGTNNTGSWQNDTWTAWSPPGTPKWSNVTKTLNSTGGLVVQWRVWANDTSNNWNDTGILSLTTSQPIVALHPSTVSWTLGSEPATSPYFNLTVDVTGIINTTAVTFSIHWNSSILNLTAVTKGNCLETGGTTEFLYVVNYTAGDLSDAVYAQITPIVPKTFPATTWGLVATLTFEFIGTSPTAGSPIDTDIVFVNEPPKKPTYWAAWEAGEPVSYNFTQMLLSHFHYEAPVGVFNLNLRVMDWDLSDSISGAYVYVNSDVKISDANGWANWTGLSGTVQVRVKWYGFWVNGTSITVDSNKTIDLQCNIFDIEVTTVEELQNALLQYVNVTVYNASVAGNIIRTGITGPDGKVSLANVPNATLTFICYDGASPKHVIGNVTRTITAENQTETITCTQNYISTTHTWGIVGIYSSALFLGLILALGFAVGKPSRMLNCLKERIKKVRSKQNKRREGGRKNT